MTFDAAGRPPRIEELGAHPVETSPRVVINHIIGCLGQVPHVAARLFEDRLQLGEQIVGLLFAAARSPREQAGSVRSAVRREPVPRD